MSSDPFRKSPPSCDPYPKTNGIYVLIDGYYVRVEGNICPTKPDVSSGSFNSKPYQPLLCMPQECSESDAAALLSRYQSFLKQYSNLMCDYYLACRDEYTPPWAKEPGATNFKPYYKPTPPNAYQHAILAAILFASAHSRSSSWRNPLWTRDDGVHSIYSHPDRGDNTNIVRPLTSWQKRTRARDSMHHSEKTPLGLAFADYVLDPAVYAIEKVLNINGNQGSATNTDDHAWLDGSMTPRISTRGPPRPNRLDRLRDQGPRIQRDPAESSAARHRFKPTPRPRPPVSLPIPRADFQSPAIRPNYLPPPDAGDPHHGEIDPHRGQSIMPEMESQTIGRAGITQINGNNGSATNTDDHMRRQHPNYNPNKRLPGRKPRPKVVVKQVFKKTIAKSRPVQKIPREISQVRSLAARYLAALKNPALPPPRLGSSGETPTTLLHGFFLATLTMPIVNTTQGTEFIAFVSPRLFSTSVTTTSFNPVNYAFGNSATANFNTVNGTIDAKGYTDQQALISSVAFYSTPTRLLSASISIDCRCAGTVSRPYLFAGLLPSNRANTDGTSQGSTQLWSDNNANIRAYPSSAELPGMTASSVYYPKDASSLEFSTLPSNNASSDPTINAAIPYVGMSGCSAGTTVTLIVSAWFEAQAASTAVQISGFARGPKVSTEEVYNELKRFNTVSPKLIQIGTRVANAGTGMLMTSFVPPSDAPKFETPLEILERKIEQLQDKISKLSVIVSEEEEEHKYVEPPLSRESQSGTRSIFAAGQKPPTPGGFMDRFTSPRAA